ncbi:MAG TPA: ATP-binding protein [Roseiflexaceae bacterium]|nr:ATP-binding protein [Roseiflexaceae bacterium]
MSPDQQLHVPADIDPWALLGDLTTAIAIIDTQLTLRYANHAWQQLSGGASIWDLIHPDDDEQVRATWNNLIATDQPTALAIEFRLRGPHEAWRWVYCRSSMLTHHLTAQPQILITADDVTARKQAEAELARGLHETTVLNRVFAATASALEPNQILSILCRELAQALALPQAAFALLRPETDDLVVVAEYCAPERPAALGTIISISGNPATQHVITHREPVVTVDVLLDPRHAGFREIGRRRGTVSLLIVPLLIGDRVIGTLGLDSIVERPFSDDEIRLSCNVAAAASQALEQARLHTALRQELAERERVEHNLRENEERLRQAKEAAEIANRAKNEFLSRMSHELRTPLNAILGFAQLLEHDQLEEEQLESVGYILKAGAHLLELIDEVLDIAHIESGRLKVTLASVHLDQIVQTAIDLVRPIAAERSIRLAAEPDPAGPITVWVDRQRLMQVLLNLCTNAIKYNRPWGLVTVRWLRRGKHAHIDILDTGYGIAANHLERLFIPFERLDAARRGVEGSGIGLALSRHLVELMNGTIGVESTLGEGSRFWIELPLTASITNRPPQRLTMTAHPTTRSVVCLDDNQAHRSLIKRIMHAYPWIRLHHGSIDADSVAYVTQILPDLILLDIDLPTAATYTLIEALQQAPSTQPIPIVVLSSDPTGLARQQILAAGARAYLGKPFDLQQLMTTLEELLEKVANQ